MKGIRRWIGRRPEWFADPEVANGWQAFLQGSPVTVTALSRLVERGSEALAAHALLALIAPVVELLPFMAGHVPRTGRYLPEHLPLVGSDALLRFLAEALEVCELTSVRERYAYYRAELFANPKLDEAVGMQLMRSFRLSADTGAGPLKVLVTSNAADEWRMKGLYRAQMDAVRNLPTTVLLEAFCGMLDDLLAMPACPLSDGIVLRQLEFLHTAQREVAWRPTWRYEAYEHALRISARCGRRSVLAVFTGSTVQVPGQARGVIITRHFTNFLRSELAPEEEALVLEKLRRAMQA